MAVHHRHRDAPDTVADFRHLAELPEGPARDRLREGLIRAWLPMAHRLAHRYRNRGETLEDLRQVAAVGLIAAVDRCDPSVGKAFESFAVPTITGEIKRHFRDRMWSVHVPRRVQNLRNVVRAACAEMASEGPLPSPARIAAHTGLTEDEVRQGSEALFGFTPLSLDAAVAVGRHQVLLRDVLGTVDDAYERVVDREAARYGIRRLPERERRVLYLRFFAGMTQSAIAAELGVSQMHVSRILSDSCRRINAAATREGGS
ncbi:SigB/SigF/SigG family RNA polymerase sigma factor [Streptomyces bohaiensis]|uniref:SigB/SigF/SigG family RNA polymerase sigma factor n=1 Tax=Streptomyces bohaiensis TaxID=1431344 RepID=A0ABX1CJN6_9ACTN|nr:SigB/SigF/SigG family RNA polymerase sigma factor [Streptomyces bohaiensis]NJQ17362.1 SigB/SigF/SigG family RNA polymerase sigma factor [Streptomyces bohaiensis]